MDKISVIVPVYNVERYLPKCLDSIIGQTYKGLEIILIDDGSPDNCAAICDAYAKEDGRIRVIHKDNEGVRIARNVGIHLATGDWITFVDSDDWCEPEYYEKLMQGADDTADIVCSGGFFKEWERKCSTAHLFSEPFTYTGREGSEKLMAEIVIFGLPWDKLYRASFLKRTGVLFDPDCKAFDDFWFNFQVFDKAETVKGIPYVGYHYRQVEASISNGYNPDKPMNNYAFVSRLHEYARQHDLSEDIKLGINAAAIRAIAVALNCYFFHPCNPASDKETWREIKDMTNWPYYHEAIYSSSNKYYLSVRRIALKYALRMHSGGYFGPFTRRSKRSVADSENWYSPDRACFILLK